MQVIRGDDEAPLEPLEGRTIAVIGYGNQGHAHALNLRDSGLQVVIGSRPEGASALRAATDGFDVVSIERAAADADLLIVGLPDETQPEVFARSITPHLRPGATIGFLHGFAIRFGLIEPPAANGVVLVAPKGPGHTLRARYLMGQGIPCLYAMHHDSPGGDAEALALAWANGIGCARAGVIRTTFADETETDLFGEQAVLCGGMTSLIVAAFETLVDAGYPPELAYLECCHEVKQVADLVYARGIAGMMAAISNTAEFGAHRAGPIVVDDALRRRLGALLEAVRDGSFAKALRDDHDTGFTWFERRRREAAEHPIERAGEAVRDLMPWLADDR